ncbi:MAG: M14 metallopeptidase family protein [Pseudomonadota bacterium]
MRAGRRRVCVVGLVGLVWWALGAAQATPADWTNTAYDPRIPTLDAVVGHAVGSEITAPADAVRYVQALAEAAPERTKLVEYARTWEGRPLVYLLVGAPERIREIEAIKADMQRLAYPRSLDQAAAEALIERLPAVVWLAYGVHGNEISGTDAGLALAYHLLAGRDDPTLSQVLQETVVAIDPSQNPDGRARFVQHYAQTRGLEPAGDGIAAERREPWPGGRTNHYYFDMNRDWLPLTQPEVRGRVASFLEYFPVVHVDAHEMGTDSTFYFPPPAQPYNPHITQTQRDMLATYGRGIASAFDRHGFAYFTRDVYDSYYPGYGDTWPAFQGSVGMTFEMASARGLVGRRRDGSLVTYADGLQRHFVGSLATVETAAAHRAEFLRNFYRYRRSALAGEHGGALAYLVPLTGDVGAVGKLADKLVAHGVRVRRTGEAQQVCDTDLPAGSFVVPGRQPAGRMVRTFLEPESPIDAAFLARQEARRARGEYAELYDVLGWSLPAMYGVPVVTCDRLPALAEGTYAGPFDPGFAPPEATTVAWLVPWGTRAAGKFLAGALRQGLTVRGADEAFTIGDRRWPAGSLILRLADNSQHTAEDLLREVRTLARATGAEVVASDTSWTEEGPSFGSADVVPMVAPRVALAWDEPTASYSAGSTRFVLERQFDYPVVPVRTADLRRPGLSRFDVLILPEGGDYADVLGERGVAVLREWVDAGGVLVGLGEALRFLTDPDVGLLATQRERLAAVSEGEREEGATVDGSLIESAEDYAAALQREAPTPDPLPGVLLRAVPDPNHWLTVGVDEQKGVNFLVEGRDVYRPLALDEGVNAMRFAPAASLGVGGHLWAENRAQWAWKPAVAVAEQGRGMVIAFASDPNFRATLDGANLLFLNAVLRGPAHARRIR